MQDVAINIFQPVRDHFNTPIGISSGYRSIKLNKAIGGSKTSQHSKGQALDLDADIFGELTNEEIFWFIRDNLTFDQLINEHNYSWIHVSYNRLGNRKQVLEAYKNKYGKTKYKLI